MSEQQMPSLAAFEECHRAKCLQLECQWLYEGCADGLGFMSMLALFKGLGFMRAMLRPLV
eukprot:6032396-Amphidinium_carterae.1